MSMIFVEVAENSVSDEIAELLREERWQVLSACKSSDTGGTLEHGGKKLGIDKTHPGVDLMSGGTRVANDSGESEILKEAETAKEAAIVVSPIGQQGFILGRGNLQIPPRCFGGWAW